MVELREEKRIKREMRRLLVEGFRQLGIQAENVQRSVAGGYVYFASADGRLVTVQPIIKGSLHWKEIYIRFATAGPTLLYKHRRSEAVRRRLGIAIPTLEEICFEPEKFVWGRYGDVEVSGTLDQLRQYPKWFAAVLAGRTGRISLEEYNEIARREAPPGTETRDDCIPPYTWGGNSLDEFNEILKREEEARKRWLAARRAAAQAAPSAS